jgi:hypothetical protein
MCRYVVLNRPYAFVQWLRAAVFPERYVFMSEPDHLWLRPMPNLMVGQRPAAFPFFYIEPAKKDFKHITEKFTGPLSLKGAESIVPMGEPPAYYYLLLIHFQRLGKATEALRPGPVDGIWQCSPRVMFIQFSSACVVQCSS